MEQTWKLRVLTADSLYHLKMCLTGSTWSREFLYVLNAMGFLNLIQFLFRQQLRGEDLDRANELAISCDLMIVVGSTLVVQPASSIPSIAKEKGALLAIITLSETLLDSYADFVFHLKVEDFINLFQS